MATRGSALKKLLIAAEISSVPRYSVMTKRTKKIMRKMSWEILDQVMFIYALIILILERFISPMPLLAAVTVMEISWGLRPKKVVA